MKILTIDVALRTIFVLACVAVSVGLVAVMVDSYRLNVKMDQQRAAYQQVMRQHCGKDRLCQWQHGLVKSLREDRE